MKSIYADKYQQIGLKIAYYRKLRGLTQEQLAERLELSPAFIGHVAVSYTHLTLPTIA